MQFVCAAQSLMSGSLVLGASWGRVLRALQLRGLASKADAKLTSHLLSRTAPVLILRQAAFGWDTSNPWLEHHNYFWPKKSVSLLCN